MRYFVFDTQAAAQAAVDLIDERGRQIYANAGYTINESGDVVGKCNGVDNPQGVTTTWDVPRQRMDGKWVFAHPEAGAMAGYEVAPGVFVRDYVVAGINDPIETGSPDWWPDPAL